MFMRSCRVRSKRRKLSWEQFQVSLKSLVFNNCISVDLSVIVVIVRSEVQMGAGNEFLNFN